jgi:hypothetical protein
MDNSFRAIPNGFHEPVLRRGLFGEKPGDAVTLSVVGLDEIFEALLHAEFYFCGVEIEKTQVYPGTLGIEQSLE